MKYTFNMDSLNRHGVTQEECLQVILAADTCWFEESQSVRGNDRVMYVGRAESESRILEVGVEFIDEKEELQQDEIEHIYHAMKARTASKRKARYVD